MKKIFTLGILTIFICMMLWVPQLTANPEIDQSEWQTIDHEIYQDRFLELQNIFDSTKDVGGETEDFYNHRVNIYDMAENLVDTIEISGIQTYASFISASAFGFVITYSVDRQPWTLIYNYQGDLLWNITSFEYQNYDFNSTTLWTVQRDDTKLNYNIAFYDINETISYESIDLQANFDSSDTSSEEHVKFHIVTGINHVSGSLYKLYSIRFIDIKVNSSSRYDYRILYFDLNSGMTNQSSTITTEVCGDDPWEAPYYGFFQLNCKFYINDNLEKLMLIHVNSTAETVAFSMDGYDYFVTDYQPNNGLFLDRYTMVNSSSFTWGVVISDPNGRNITINYVEGDFSTRSLKSFNTTISTGSQPYHPSSSGQHFIYFGEESVKIFLTLTTRHISLEVDYDFTIISKPIIDDSTGEELSDPVSNEDATFPFFMIAVTLIGLTKFTYNKAKIHNH